MRVRLRVNGKDEVIETEDHRTLLDALRSELGLTGTKYGCGIGQCGACTVLIDGDARCACLVPIGQVEGREIETVEGLAEGENLHPLQQAFVENHAVQCGFCTPGMLMSAMALLRKTPSPSEEDIRVAIAGNLCRCTGYQQILRAVKQAAESMRTSQEESGAPLHAGAGGQDGLMSRAGLKTRCSKNDPDQNG
jgi:aerobic-type carbon monoxide dehydrogenase small subunit (CoxS/CutS family)